MSGAERAVARFDQGYNCAQSVLAAYSGELGVDEETALKLAAALGGGIARMAETCGAVTGALLLLGLRYGSTEITREAKEYPHRLAHQFMKRFTEKHGSVRCKELLGYDISSDEGLQAARAAGVTRTLCPCLVRDAAEIVGEMLGGTPAQRSEEAG